MSDPGDIGSELGSRLEAFYTGVAETSMRGLPMFNGALGVRAVGIQPWSGEWLCVLITPWFINLVLMPAAEEQIPVQIGASSMVSLPVGMVSFIQSDGLSVGPHRMCSLFSPVFEFETMDAAVLTAQAVLDELLSPADEAEDADGMVAIWEGRIEDAEQKAEAERLAEATEIARAEAASSVEAREAPMSRRSLLGLPGQAPAMGAEP